MKTVAVHSTKYDGSLHYRYDAALVHESAELLMIYVPPGTPIDCYRGQHVARYHSLGLLWADRSYNLEVSWYADWRPRMHYVNVATPATWHDGTIRFIDLDLDVIWRAENDEVILDDEDEFALHQLRFGYPSDLIARCWQSSMDVRELIAQRTYPFDGSLNAWRPNGFA